MNELEQHIKAENDRMNAEGWNGCTVEDAAHWAKYGITTVEDYEKYMLSCTIDEMHKEIYGCRLRQGWKGITMEELEASYNSLTKQLDAHQEEQQSMQEQAIADFEKVIADTVTSGASDRKTAIRWLRDATNDQDCIRDDNYFEYINDIPYGYLKKEVA